jgi:SAM-dependent methyltransferase
MTRVRLPETFVAYLERRLNLDLTEPRLSQLRPFASRVAELSRLLTRTDNRSFTLSRPNFDDPSGLEAYLLYYTATNLPKVFYPLNEISAGNYFRERAELSVLDLGAGTGAMTVGTARWMNEAWPGHTVSFHAVDRSSLALAELRRMFDALGFPHHLFTTCASLEEPLPGHDRYDLIIAGNVLNELPESGERTIERLLDDRTTEGGFVILIEPALRGTSRRLLQFRDRTLKNGWFVYSPCCTAQPCPALFDADGWCHHDLEWERPKFIEVIDEEIGLIKKSLKFSYLVLSRRNVHLTNASGERDFVHRFRAVSERFREKGRTRMFLCNDLGRRPFVKNRRDTTDANRAFDQLERYDVVEIRNYEVRENDVKIVRESKVQRLR